MAKKTSPTRRKIIGEILDFFFVEAAGCVTTGIVDGDIALKGGVLTRIGLVRGVGGSGFVAKGVGAVSILGIGLGAGGADGARLPPITLSYASLSLGSKS